MKTIVVGLGNPILTDDGVGVLVAREVKKRLGQIFGLEINVTEACVGGLRLMEMLVGYDKAIIIDAIRSNNGKSPGTITRMTIDDLRDISPTQHSSCPHDTSLITAIDFGKTIGVHLPENISIYAVEALNLLEFSEIPTPEVEQAIPAVVDAVFEEIITDSHSINN